MPVVGVEPTRVISTRDFEFSSPSLIWCHPVLSNDTPFPARISIFTHLRSIKHQIFDFSLRFPSAPILWFGTSKRKLEGYLGGMQSSTPLCLGTKRKESQGWWTKFKQKSFMRKCLQVIPMFSPWRMQQNYWASKARPPWYGGCISTGFAV